MNLAKHWTFPRKVGYSEATREKEAPMPAETFEINPFDAVLYTGENLAEVHELLGTFAADYITPYLYSVHEKRYVSLRKDHWVVLLETGAQFMMDEATYNLVYGDLVFPEDPEDPEQCECYHASFAYDGTGIHRAVERELGRLNEYVTPQDGMLRGNDNMLHMLPSLRQQRVTIEGATRETLDENLIRTARIHFGDDGKIGIPDNYIVTPAAPYDGTGGFQTTTTIFELKH